MGDLTPITREEYYLARMAGEDVTMPEPITREEEYMKGIAAQIEAGSAELPAVTDVDEGKILAVNANGKWDKADAPTELPEVTATDNGDVLTVVEGAWAKAAINKPTNIFSKEMILKEIETTTNTTFTFNALTEDASIKYRRIYFVFLDSEIAGVSALFALVPKFSNGSFIIATVKLFEIGGSLFTSIEAAMAFQTGSLVTVTPTRGTSVPYSARVYASDLLN